MLHYYLIFSFHLKLALLTQLPTSNERKIPPHIKIKPAKFHNGGFTQDLYMHICSISVKFQLWKNSMNALKSVARTQRVKCWGRVASAHSALGSDTCKRCRRWPDIGLMYVTLTHCISKGVTTRWPHARRRWAKLDQHWVNVSCLLGLPFLSALWKPQVAGCGCVLTQTCSHRHGHTERTEVNLYVSPLHFFQASHSGIDSDMTDGKVRPISNSL